MAYQKPPRLTEAELTAALTEIPDWTQTGEEIRRVFTFKTFMKAMAFVNQVATIAEADDHHPDAMVVNWNRVTLTYVTHDAGGLTHKDIAAAKKVDALVTESDATSD